MTDDATLAGFVAGPLRQMGIEPDGRLSALCALFKDRCDTTVALAQWLRPYYQDVSPSEADRAQYLTDAVRPALAALADALAQCDWTKEGIAAALKAVLGAHGLKMPQLAMPVRVLVMGTPQTPSLDAVLALFDREKVVARLKNA